MKEGPVPVPSYRPYVYRDDDVVPVWAVSHLREPLACGGDTPGERSGFYEPFLQSLKKCSLLVNQKLTAE
jgi:hypothetical protein